MNIVLQTRNTDDNILGKQAFRVFLNVIFILIWIAPASICAQTVWGKYDANPVLESAPGEWDYGLHFGIGSVIFDGSTYRMWYSGGPLNLQQAPTQIGYATSSDGVTWDKHKGNPVLTVGPPGSWDVGEVRFPSVLFDGSTYHMWYNGYDTTNDFGSFRVGYATSGDGIGWTKHDSNPVLDLGPGGSWDDVWILSQSVVFDGATYHMWYTGLTDDYLGRVGYATSSDRVTWAKYNDTATTDTPFAESDPVLLPGPPGAWDESDVAFPSVIFNGTFFEMWYFSRRMGYATSSDGITWTKHQSNPVFTGGPAGSWDLTLWSRAIRLDGGTYSLWYDGGASGSLGIGYALSPKGVSMGEFTVTPTYAVPGTDSVMVTAVSNGSTAGLSLFAEIESPDQVPIDMIQLYDDGTHDDGSAGDSLYGNIWLVPAQERHYFVDLQVTVVDTDTVNIEVHNKGGQFTTIGPVKFENFTTVLSDSIPNPGDNMFVLINLRNEGSTGTAANVRASLSSDDTCLAFLDRSPRDYGDIGPGGTSTSEAAYRIKIDENCSGGTNRNISFDLSIASDGYVFWRDRFAIYAYLESAHQQALLPDKFALHQNYPNPLNPTTSLGYDLPERSEVTLSIYDILGRQVRTLVQTAEKPGYKSVIWDGTNDLGEQVSAGVYLYCMQAGDFTQTRKMVLLR